MKVIFTIHALERLKKRNITQQEIEEILKYPDNISKRHGKYYYRKDAGRGEVEVSCERTETHIKVITFYWI